MATPRTPPASSRLTPGPSATSWAARFTAPGAAGRFQCSTPSPAQTHSAIRLPGSTRPSRLAPSPSSSCTTRARQRTGRAWSDGNVAFKNLNRFAAAYTFNGNLGRAQDLDASLTLALQGISSNPPINPILREPLSGTMTTTEFNVFRTTETLRKSRMPPRRKPASTLPIPAHWAQTAPIRCFCLAPAAQSVIVPSVPAPRSVASATWAVSNTLRTASATPSSPSVT